MGMIEQVTVSPDKIDLDEWLVTAEKAQRILCETDGLTRDSAHAIVAAMRDFVALELDESYRQCGQLVQTIISIAGEIERTVAETVESCASAAILKIKNRALYKAIDQLKTSAIQISLYHGSGLRAVFANDLRLMENTLRVIFDKALLTIELDNIKGFDGNTELYQNSNFENLRNYSLKNTTALTPLILAIDDQYERAESVADSCLSQDNYDLIIGQQLAESVNNRFLRDCWLVIGETWRLLSSRQLEIHSPTTIALRSLLTAFCRVNSFESPSALRGKLDALVLLLAVEGHTARMECVFRHYGVLSGEQLNANWVQLIDNSLSLSTPDYQTLECAASLTLGLAIELKDKLNQIGESAAFPEDQAVVATVCSLVDQLSASLIFLPHVANREGMLSAHDGLQAFQERDNIVISDIEELAVNVLMIIELLDNSSDTQSGVNAQHALLAQVHSMLSRISSLIERGIVLGGRGEQLADAEKTQCLSLLEQISGASVFLQPDYSRQFAAQVLHQAQELFSATKMEPALLCNSLQSLAGEVDQFEQVLSGAQDSLPINTDSNGEGAGNRLVNVSASEEALNPGLSEERAVTNEVTNEAQSDQDNSLDTVIVTMQPARQSLADAVDDEIAEIFAEEANEILEEIGVIQRGWRVEDVIAKPLADVTTKAISDIRRCFHTLKGSGRMAGAVHLAELSWAIENMLNRILDGVVRFALEHDTLLWQVVDTLPELVLDFENRLVPVVDIEELSLRAEVLSQADSLNMGENVRQSGVDATASEVDAKSAYAEAGHSNELDTLNAELDDIIERLVGSATQFREGAGDEALKLATIQIHTILGILPENENSVLKNIARIAEEHLGALASGSTDSEITASLLETYCELLRQGHVAPSEDVLERAVAMSATGGADGGSEKATRALQDAIKCSDLLFEVEPLLFEWRSSRVAGDQLNQLVYELDRLIGADNVPVQIIALLQSLRRVYKLVERRSLSFGLFNLLRRAHEDLENQLSAALIDQAIEHSAYSGLLDQYCEEQQHNVLSVEEAAAFNASETELDGEQDQEIVAIFKEELSDLIEQIQECHAHWDIEARAVQLLKPMLRPLHTVKGSARMASVDAIARMAHDLETSIQHLIDYRNRDNTSNRERIDQGIKNFLKTCADFISGTAPAMSKRQGPMIERRARDRQVSKSSSKDTVRVSAQILDRLNNLADENSISRSVIEQRILDFSEGFEEVDATLMRLTEQLRHLDIETEAQIGSRTRRLLGDEVEGFDPLEFDRYSKLQQLSRSLVESSSDLKDLYSTMRDSIRNVETMLSQQSRITREMQQSLQQTRTVSLSKVLIPRMKRTLVGLSEELGKPVSLSILNVDGELDKRILDRLVGPLEHILRNAIDHGIETAEQREANGKSAQGLICVDISRKGGELQIDIQDDGKGLDVAAIKCKAAEKGMIQADQDISRKDVFQLIFESGFSTAEQLTQISGRGVGLDVVATELKQMGGSVSADSEPGKGSTFTMRIPFNVSLNRALLVNCGIETFAIPLESLQGIVRVSSFELEELYADPSLGFSYAGQDYDFRYLGSMLQGEQSQFKVDEYSAVPVLLSKAGGNPVAFQVDRLMGSREVVLKTLGPKFKPVPGIAGATILGDGSVVTILDLPELYRVSAQRKVEPLGLAYPESTASQPQCRGLVVDDSVTVRKVTSRLLERLSVSVETAKDGLDALSIMETCVPDFVLLDVEMPRLDGFEVLSHMRKDERLAKVPVIMISSRSGSKHKLRAADLGANAFLGKPYQDLKLCSALAEHCPSFAEQYQSSGDDQLSISNG